jgi:hypothetical protein
MKKMPIKRKRKRIRRLYFWEKKKKVKPIMHDLFKMFR